jgi:HSP20 family protein
MYRSMFPRELFSELDRLQRDLQQQSDIFPSIRGFARGGFPAINIGRTPTAVEIYAFAPGLNPANIEVQIERGTLTIAGERKSELPTDDSQSVVHFDERFSGHFRRVISLPDDVDANGVTAEYRDGVLHISVKRQESALPRRIAIH